MAGLLFLSIASDALRRELGLFQRKKIRAERELAEATEAAVASEVAVVHPDQTNASNAEEAA